DQNDSITSLDTLFPGNPQIEGTLTITNNAKLATLGALDHLSGINGPAAPTAITITSNAALPYCEARHVGCCVAHPGTAQIGTGNPGCNSWCLDAGQGSCYATTH